MAVCNCLTFPREEQLFHEGIHAVADETPQEGWIYSKNTEESTRGFIHMTK